MKNKMVKIRERIIMISFGAFVCSSIFSMIMIFLYMLKINCNYLNWAIVGGVVVFASAISFLITILIDSICMKKH